MQLPLNIKEVIKIEYVRLCVSAEREEQRYPDVGRVGANMEQ